MLAVSPHSFGMDGSNRDPGGRSISALSECGNGPVFAPALGVGAGAGGGSVLAEAGAGVAQPAGTEAVTASSSSLGSQSPTPGTYALTIVVTTGMACSAVSRMAASWGAPRTATCSGSAGH